MTTSMQVKATRSDQVPFSFPLPPTSIPSLYLPPVRVEFVLTVLAFMVLLCRLKVFVYQDRMWQAVRLGEIDFLR